MSRIIDAIYTPTWWELFPPHLRFWRVPLDELIISPLRVNELPAEEQHKLLLQLPALQTALAAVVLIGHPEPKTEKSEPDVLLTVEEAAKILAVTPGWLYAHSKTLPFVRKISHKRLRFSRLGLERWLATKVNKR